MKFTRNSTSQSISRELRRNFKLQADNYDLLLRKTVSILTTGQDPQFRIPKTLKEILLLCCISWYLPDELGILLRLKIREDSYRFESEHQQKICLLLSSEAEMIIYILESSVLGETPEAVFGNIRAIQPKVKVFTLMARKPKRAIRHRGYRDKGSLRQGSEYLTEERNDFSCFVEQQRLEEERRELQDSIALVLGFLQ